MKRYFKPFKLTALVCVIAIMVTFFAGCGNNSKPTDSGKKPNGEKKVITLRVGSGHAESSAWVYMLENYFVKEVSKRVSERTNYEIEWIKAYGGSVIKLGDELEGIEAGLVDIGVVVWVFEPAKLMLNSMVYRMPFACSDPVIVGKVVDQLYKEYPEFIDVFKGYNQKLLGVAVSDPYSLFSTKEVKSLADIKGMKIGAAGANLSWITGSSAVPVQTSLNECYQSLQTNVYQATIMPTHSSYNLKLPEVAPYLLEANFNALPHNPVTINLNKWESLPKEVQDILAEVGKEYSVEEPKYVKEVYAKDIESMKQNGVKVYALPREEQEKWAATLPDVVNALVNELNQKGYKGTEIVNRYYELLEKEGIKKVRDWKIK